MAKAKTKTPEAGSVPTELKGGSSPRGIAAYAWLDKKDTRFSKGDETKAKFKVSLVLDKDDPKVQTLVELIQARHAANEGREKTCPVKDGDVKVDKEGKSIEEFSNKWLIVFQTSHKPTMIDSKKNPLPKSVKIWSGDIIKVAFTPIDYDTGATSGVSLRMGAVQLLEKRAGGVGAEAFEEEEGYEAPEDDGSDDNADTADATDPAGSSGGDY